MNRFSPRIIIALITFCLGVTIATIELNRRSAPNIAPTSTVEPNPASEPNSNTQPPEQNSYEPPQRYGGRPIVVSFDPQEIARLVNRSKRIIEEVNLEPFWQEMGIDSGGFTFTDGPFRAEVERVELDGQVGREIVIKLPHSFHFCRFLIFKLINAQSSRPQWKFLGYIDHDFNRYEMASHRIVTNGNKSWLVIRGQVGSGSGFSFYYDSWYEVNDNGIREVLSYPASGHVAPWPEGLGSRIASTVAQQQPASRPPLIRVNFTVSYTLFNYITEEYPFLFSKLQSVYFLWNENSQRFEFDSSRSDISREEFYSVYNLESEERVDLIRYYFDDLMRIARGRNAMHREWLRERLDESSDSEEKRFLERELARSTR